MDEDEGERGSPDRTGQDEDRRGVSPYSTGGGGVTFERKVAVSYLAHLLMGDGAVELGDGRRVLSVRFQQAPAHAVDDLVVHAAREDEAEVSLVLAVGVRRAPAIVQSDESTKKLIADFVRGVIEAPVDGPEHRFALVVAGAQQHAQQLGVLSSLAAKQMDAEGFFDLVRTPGKYTAEVRARLEQIEALVESALIGLGISNPHASLVQERSWELLSRLSVLMARLETPDEADWGGVVNSLVSVARRGNLDGAERLRDRLSALAADYPAGAAAIDETILRRDAHSVLDSSVRRDKRGWDALGHLDGRALSSVHDTIATIDGSRSVHLDRSEISDGLIALASADGAVIAHGESGVGKSTVLLLGAAAAAHADPDNTQVTCIDLRHLPGTSLEFEAILGQPLGVLLEEMSAPKRLLLIDGADAVAEGMVDQLQYLLDAAYLANVGVVAITAADNKQVVWDLASARFGTEVSEYLVPALTDAEIEEVVSVFGELADLAANVRSREVLRRTVVIDLFVRSGVSGVPLSDADAMQQVWRGLVRRHEKADRGTPDGRDLAMLRLAELALSDGDPVAAVGAIDAASLEGLRQDGLLRRPVDDPFRVGPEFAHDEVRRYAVARLLLSADPAAKLLDVGVPRWALGAARLACQVLLSAPDSVTNPVSGRFARLQTAFDGLASSGHGERWGDVPGEALLTTGDPCDVLEDAWPDLRANDDQGLIRLCRLVDQRLRGEFGLTRVHAVEPLIRLLLDEETPWWSEEPIQGLMRDWLRSLAVADTPAGYGLRVRLSSLLVAACATADNELLEAQAAASAARAARTAEEIEEERQFLAAHHNVFGEIGYGGRERRGRPEVPREITDEIVVEFLALLGADIGDGGEAVLRRIGRDAPAWLAPAVEEPAAGRALAANRTGLLAELTEAYYLDEEEDGSSYLEDGIRDHTAHGIAASPLAAWYRGPFTALFRTDFRNGVAVLNRMLNHAAAARSRSLTDLGRSEIVGDGALDEYHHELGVAGTRRVFVGDPHVWMWYRGTGVGPYPCMSALQALERVCDQLIEAGLPIYKIIDMLLDGCKNLAMVGLVVGMLVRHLEDVERSLDPYLAEPLVWSEEFSRVVSESSGLAASSEGIKGADRRQWSLREAGVYLVVHGDDARVAELRDVGATLIANARHELVSGRETSDEGGEPDSALVEQQLVHVRAWASGLDRATYKVEETSGGLVIQSVPSVEITEAMEADNRELERSHTATRLMVRYFVEPKRGHLESVPIEELIADLGAARELLKPPVVAVGDPLDVVAAVAGAAIEANLVRGEQVPDDLMDFAVDSVLRVADGEGSPREFEYEETYFEQAADRSAARALPMLLLPDAAELLRRVRNTGRAAPLEPSRRWFKQIGTVLRLFSTRLVRRRTGMASDLPPIGHDRVVASGMSLARATAREVRVHLARGLDRVWTAPCSAQGRCHHEVALNFVIASMRDAAFGGWDAQAGGRRVVPLGDPIEEALAKTADDAIYFSRLDAAIRALAPAHAADICVSPRAGKLLEVCLAAHRRSLLAHDRNMDSRGTHASMAARALLVLASHGEDSPLEAHIDAYADNPTLGGTFLRALTAAGEENQEAASTALRLWPDIVVRVISLRDAGRTPFEGAYGGDYNLAALLPNAAGEVAYLYRELEGEPIAWWDPALWTEEVQLWVPLAVGDSRCVDQLVSFLGVLSPADQVRLGLPWVSNLVLPDPSQIASRCFLLTSWLIEVRSEAVDGGVLDDWQRVVDALVVAGDGRLAPYSE